MFKNIVCPVDFSTCSRHALAVAVELAKSSDAVLTLVHVWHVPSYGIADTVGSGTMIQELAEDAQRSLGDWEAGARGDGVKHVASKLMSGAPWSDVVRIATELQADLIVMGTHGRTGLAHVLIGSVAERVVQHAACAVLVVR